MYLCIRRVCKDTLVAKEVVCEEPINWPLISSLSSFRNKTSNF